MTESGMHEQIDQIREIFAYTERFRGKTFVINIANSIIEHPGFPQLAGDLALLHKAGIRTVIVPGARERINDVLERYGIHPCFKDGIRITDPNAIDLVKMAAFDVAHRIMTALSGHGITAVIGNWVKARMRGVVDGVDFGRTGMVDRIHLETAAGIMEQGAVLIFPCIGHNETGDAYNLSSDELTRTAALCLNASKIFFLGVDPVLKESDFNVPTGIKVLDDGRLFRLTPADVQQFLAVNPDCSSRTSLENAALACKSGVLRCHILDGRYSGVLLKEVFSNLGTGVMVYADDYERIRPMESSDVPGVLELMEPLITTGVLVERSREDLERKQKDYWVYAMDGVVHGCIALHPMVDGTAEIAGIAVDPRYTQLGIGRKLISHVESIAAETGICRLFVLTTQTADWFLAQGFHEAAVSDLPTEKVRIYNRERNSRILIKNLFIREKK